MGKINLEPEPIYAPAVRAVGNTVDRHPLRTIAALLSLFGVSMSATIHDVSVRPKNFSRICEALADGGDLTELKMERTLGVFPNSPHPEHLLPLLPGSSELDELFAVCRKRIGKAVPPCKVAQSILVSKRSGLNIGEQMSAEAKAVGNGCEMPNKL